MTLVAVALLRGSVVGAVGGFFAGLLVDTATLGTLGLTSLVLTIAGYWIGRYGETTGRDRAHAPFLSVAVVTVLYSVGAPPRALRARRARTRGRRCCAGSLPAIVLNLILTAPVYALVRRLLAAARPPRPRDRGAAPWLARRRSGPRDALRAGPTARRVVEPYRVTPRLALRVGDRSASSLLVVFGALFLRLWALQVLAGTKYVDQARRELVPDRARRRRRAGSIVDRNGSAARDERPGDGRPALAGRPAEGLRRALPRAAAALAG